MTTLIEKIGDFIHQIQLRQRKNNALLIESKKHPVNAHDWTRTPPACSIHPERIKVQCTIPNYGYEIGEWFCPDCHNKKQEQIRRDNERMWTSQIRTKTYHFRSGPLVALPATPKPEWLAALSQSTDPISQIAQSTGEYNLKDFEPDQFLLRSHSRRLFDDVEIEMSEPEEDPDATQRRSAVRLPVVTQEVSALEKLAWFVTGENERV